MPSRRSGGGVVLLGVAPRELQRRERQLHHVRAFFGRELEAAREVHVEDVEAAGAESELTRLNIDDDIVADLNRTGQPRIREARLAVDLEPDEAVRPLDDAGDATSSKGQHRARRRSARA